MTDDLISAARRVLSDRTDAALAALELAVLRRDVAMLVEQNTALHNDNVALAGELDALQLERSQWGAHHDAQAARIAQLEAVVTESDAAITRLVRERDEAREELARRPVIHERAPAAPESEPVTFDPCPHCGKADFTRKVGRTQHVKYCPQNPQRKGVPGRALEAEPVAVAVVAVGGEDTPDWRCAQCKSDAFAPALHDPTRCIRCAQEARHAA